MKSQALALITGTPAPESRLPALVAAVAKQKSTVPKPNLSGQTN